MMVIRFLLITLASLLLLSAGANEPREFLWVGTEPEGIRVVYQKVWFLPKRLAESPAIPSILGRDDEEKDRYLRQRLDESRATPSIFGRDDEERTRPGPQNGIQHRSDDKIDRWKLLSTISVTLAFSPGTYLKN